MDQGASGTTGVEWLRLDERTETILAGAALSAFVELRLGLANGTPDVVRAAARAAFETLEAAAREASLIAPEQASA